MSRVFETHKATRKPDLRSQAAGGVPVEDTSCHDTANGRKAMPQFFLAEVRAGKRYIYMCVYEFMDTFLSNVIDSYILSFCCATWNNYCP